MSGQGATGSARRSELLDAAYEYVLSHGLGDMSLRPLASAIGSSPRVLLYLFGSKEGLIRDLLARARSEELELLSRVRRPESDGPRELVRLAEEIWTWLVAAEHRALLKLWVEAYARSLTEPDGPWSGFAQATVDDWLAVLSQADGGEDADRIEQQRPTAVLAVLRGALLDVLATDDIERTTRAVRQQLAALVSTAEAAS